MAYSKPDEPTPNSGRLCGLLKRLRLSSKRPTSVRCSAVAPSNRIAPGASATRRLSSPSIVKRSLSKLGNSNLAICCAVCAARCRARSASVIGVTGCVPMVGWRSSRCTWASMPERANRVPNRQYLPSAGVPATIGITASPKAARARSITRPMLPIAGELSKVEHTL